MLNLLIWYFRITSAPAGGNVVSKGAGRGGGGGKGAAAQKAPVKGGRGGGGKA